MKKLISGLLLPVFFCMMLFHDSAQAADTIKLGVAGAHSGDYASYGIPASRAAELVVKKINAAGGVLGRQVELLVEDDLCKPLVAGNAATKLISDGVDVVLGHICTGPTKTAAGFYKEAGIVLMSPSATGPDLTLSGKYPNFFRTIAHDDVQARLQVDFATRVLKVNKVAILHDKQAYGKGAAELARKYFNEAGTKVVLFEGVTAGQPDYSAVVNKIRKNKPQLVVWGGYHPEASKLVTLMSKRRMKNTLFLGPDGVKDDTFIKVAKEHAEGAYATGPMDTSSNPLAIQARNEHRETYGEDPGSFYDAAYAAALCLLNAIEKAGTTDYNDIVNSLRNNPTDTPLGKLKFDRNGDAIGIGYAVYKVENGKFVEQK